MFTVVRPARLTAGLTALVAAASAGWALGVPTAPAQAVAHPAAARPAAASRTATTVPPGRQWASFAYDPQHHELVLFGGNDSSTVFGDTWTRQRGLWKQRHPARSPSARTGAAMAYDAATGQLLLFGGSAGPGTEGGFDGQTWTWTGHTWRRLHPATSPPARHNADMIYDAASQDVILFGGYDGHYLGDTWAWTGTTWTQLSPATSPSPRDSESLVYDPASQTAIMYGGFNSEASRLSDTWSWNGTTWTQLSPATTPGVITLAWQAGYDASSQQVLLFGGDPGNGRPPHNGTWAWTGTTWAQLSPAAAPRPDLRIAGLRRGQPAAGPVRRQRERPRDRLPAHNLDLGRQHLAPGLTRAVSVRCDERPGSQTGPLQSNASGPYRGPSWRLQNATLALMYARSSREAYSTVSAIWNAAYDAGMGAGAMGIGLLVARTGYPGAFLLTAALVVPALLPARRERRQPGS